MQKGFVVTYLLFGVLVLAALGGAYYFGKSQVLKPQTQNQVVSPTPLPATTSQPASTSEIANWKAYANDTYRYSFAIPPNWLLVENSEDDSKGFVDRQLKTPQDFADAVMGAIAVNKKTPNYATNKEYFDHFYNQINPEPGTTTNKLSINGEPAIMLIKIGEPNTILDGKEQIEVFTYHKGNVFEIGITGKKESVDKNKNLFDQILSTFKFLDQKQESFKDYGGFDPAQHPCGSGDCKR